MNSSFWQKRDTNQMPLMQVNNVNKALQLDFQNNQKVQNTFPANYATCAIQVPQQQYANKFFIQPQQQLQTISNNPMSIEIESCEDNYSKNLPILIESQSQHSTDASSSSSGINSANSEPICPHSYDQYIEQTNMNEQNTPSSHPLSKTQSNEDVYFARVFTNNMMDIKEPSDFLSRHAITPAMRAKMIDWMIEVLKAYSYSETTFSLAVAIMDTYFANVNKSINVSELHVIGVTSMFIASKYEEIIPFTLQKVYEKIAHEKISIASIKKTEADILSTLDFCLTFPTLDTLSNLMIKYLDLQNFFSNYSPDSKDFFRSLNAYMHKLATFDYELVSQYNSKILAVSSVFVSIKVMEQYYPNFNSFYYLEELFELIGLSYPAIIVPSTKLLTLAKSFETYYPNLKNLKKYNLEDINRYQAKIGKQNKPDAYVSVQPESQLTMKPSTSASSRISKKDKAPVKSTTFKTQQKYPIANQ